MSVGFIVPVLSRFDLFTDLMSTVDMDIRPIVIDNWRENRGVAAAWNMGMQKCLDLGIKYTFISNDDAVFYPGSMFSMYLALRSTNAVMVSAAQNGDPNWDHPIHEGADFCCFAVNVPRLIEHCGWFDENFQPAYFEDNDMHRRIILSGQKSYIVPRAAVRHHGSATQNHTGQPVVPPNRFEDNRRYFSEKWGGVPGQETYATPFNNPEMTIRDWNRR
jgi:GT2 family glycosyltransferase